MHGAHCLICPSHCKYNADHIKYTGGCCQCPPTRYVVSNFVFVGYDFVIAS